jgi:hypothetical protein
MPWAAKRGREEYLRGRDKVKEFAMTSGGADTTACHPNNELESIVPNRQRHLTIQMNR